MPLKIRCPHCRRVLLAEDDTAGHLRACPACGRPFEVPPRLSDAPTPHTKSRKCPNCATEVAPRAAHCHHCLTDLATGRPPTWKVRWRLRLQRSWAAAAASLTLLILVALVVTRLYRIHAQPPATTAPAPVVAAGPDLQAAQALFDAVDPAARQAAIDRLSRSGEPAVSGVLAALDESLRDQASSAIQQNQLAAIDWLARRAPGHAALIPRSLEVLRRCSETTPLRHAAMRAQALLGDDSVLADLRSQWLECLERLLFVSRLETCCGGEAAAAAKTVSARARRELERRGEGLRRLAEEEKNEVFEEIVPEYWDSWPWLGQGAGDGFAREVFALAEPPEKSMQFHPEQVRGPRDVLKRVSLRASPAGRAAAGIILKELAPQYRTLAESIGTELGLLLPECRAIDQQRLTWAIAQLCGKHFGPVQRSHPLEVTAAEVAAAEQWARPDQPPVVRPGFPGIPELAYRASTPQRQLERDLLKDLSGGWDSAGRALDRWLETGLGSTPRLAPILHPGQRSPDYPALAAAMVIVATAQDESYRQQLELWREARDQPPWVRALAYTVLGSFDARDGHWASGWPARLNLGDLNLLDAGTPGWLHFGRVLAAGGPQMTQRLRDFKPVPLPAAVQSKLLDAARQAGSP